ncbi:hypothetical protein GOODEAATRI_028328 [Goodea atripinnis]|uniref:Uncharacterized protein n=1 Tax=Goodea atripinnis TaxID=208336 RepID=A0ABV0NP79_9TELE
MPASQSSQLASPPEHQPVSLPTHPPAVQADLTEQSGPSGAEGVIIHSPSPRIPSLPKIKQPTDEQQPGSPLLLLFLSVHGYEVENSKEMKRKREKIINALCWK